MRFEIVFQTGGDWSNSFEHSKRQLVERGVPCFKYLCQGLKVLPHLSSKHHKS